jgi:hypothetical protein
MIDTFHKSAQFILHRRRAGKVATWFETPVSFRAIRAIRVFLYGICVRFHTKDLQFLNAAVTTRAAWMCHPESMKWKGKRRFIGAVAVSFL